jgi:hypothetical protein
LNIRQRIVSEATWVLLTDNQEFLNREEVRQAAAAARVPERGVIWTDSYSNLFTLLNWRDRSRHAKTNLSRKAANPSKAKEQR